MKKIFFLSITILIFLSSCTSVEFKSLQALENRKKLDQFPENIIGTYIDEAQDTLIITENTFNYFESNSSSNTFDGTLNEGKTELINYNHFIVLCDKEDDSWNLFPFKYSNDILSVYFIDLEGQKEKLKEISDDKERERIVVNRIEKITKVEEVLSSDGNKEKYLINPTEKEFSLLFEKRIFSKLLDFKKIY